jgi:hypothetical protein
MTTTTGFDGWLGSSPTADFEAALGGTGLTQLVNLTALIEGNHILLTARFADTTGALLPVPLAIALTPEQADQLAGALHAHAAFAEPELYRHSRWR